MTPEQNEAASGSVLQIDDEMIQELRPFPSVASRVLAACDDPDSTSRTIAEIMQCDAGYASRLLQMANSSLYGFSGAIHTVEHAVVVLGFRQVRDLALAIAGDGVFSSGSSAARERAELWEHSLACGTVARLLASHVEELIPEEAFLAGIFHDVGKLVLFDVVPDAYVPIVRAKSDVPLVAREQESFGTEHGELGARCVDSWGLWDAIQMAAHFHHQPETAEHNLSLVSLVHVANQLTKSWELGQASDASEAAPADFAISQLKLEPEFIDGLRDQAQDEFDEIRSLCTGAAT